MQWCGVWAFCTDYSCELCCFYPDVEVEVEFEEPTYTAVENERMVEVCVRVTSENLQREITVKLSSLDGQAICESSVA